MLGLVSPSRRPESSVYRILKAHDLIGLQAIGAEFDDRTTIEFTRLVAEEMGGYVPAPAFV